MSLSFFNTDDAKQRLFLTFKRNPENYHKIKSKLTAENLKIRYQRTKKSLRFFFAALTFIIVISSAFAIVGDQPNSLTALWIIWSINLTFVILANRYNYQINYKNQENQILFFKQFEEIALRSETKENFIKNWNSIK